jgi:hypothetical protein
VTSYKVTLSDESKQAIGCSFATGFVSSSHVSKSSAEGEDSGEMSARAKELLRQIKTPRTVWNGRTSFSCGSSTNSFAGGCHPCVAKAMELAGIWPVGVYPEGNMYPRDFADKLTPSALQTLRLKDVTSELGRNAKKARPGDIVIHDLCGHPRAGHISVVGERGEGHSDTRESPLLLCSGGRGLLKILRPL